MSWALTRIQQATAPLLTIVLIGLASSAGAVEAGARRAGDLLVESRSLTTAAGETVNYELGTIFVPENRAVAGSRLIGVGFVRIKAAQPTGAPPTFHLPGGPGGSFLDGFTEEGDWPRFLLGLVLPYRAAGDVVIVDQRGWTRRGDRMTYAPRRQTAALDRPASIEADAQALVQAAKTEIAANPGKDLRGYTVVECVEDVNDLRKALGYETVSLVGQSFGSQWSFAVMRLHPEIVTRALLSGVEPLDYAYDMPSQIFAALQRIAWDADQDPGLAPYLPEGGLMAAVRAVRDRLARAPVRVPVKNDKTGATETVVLGLSDFQRLLLADAPEWPAAVLSAYHGRYEGWARAVLTERAAIDGEEPLIGPLIDTSLGVSAARRHLLWTDAGVDYLGRWDFGAYLASADAWPTPDVGDDLRRPVLTRIPVVFVHGDWDTSTPIENTLNMLPYFPDSRTVLVHRGSHGAQFRLVATDKAFEAAIIAYLRTGDTSALPVNATVPAPAFKIPSFTPPARPFP